MNRDILVLVGVDGAQVGNIQFDPDKPIVTADISLTQDQSIEIQYGWYDGENGGAVAPHYPRPQ